MPLIMTMEHVMTGNTYIAMLLFATRTRFQKCVVSMFTVLVVATTAIDHRDLFPTNDEYDFNILDPDSVYGSPFGGYSRNTRSRLAALPLRLPSVIDGSSSSSDPPIYMEISDASGRPFVCREYHDDEIHPASLASSMFDPPRDISIDAKDLSTSDQPLPKYLETPDVLGLDYNPFGESSDGVKTTTTTIRPNDIGTLLEVTKRLTQLVDVCAQLHKGWWSYEWCFAQKVMQFHIHVEEVEFVGTTFILQDPTRLGDKARRTIDIITSNPEKHVPNPLADGVKELARVHDVYEDGDLCPETNVPRVTHVTMVCCSHRVLESHKTGIMKRGKPLSSNIASFMSIEEDPEVVCIYNITICTPLLCEKGNGSVGGDDTGSKNRRLKQDVMPDSIRDILEANLDNVCLQGSFGGWWTYELCHGRHVRQFHERIALDPRTGKAHRAAESEHKLGYYSADDLEDFLDEDEWKYVVNRTDDLIGFGADGGGTSHGGNGAYFVQEYTGGDVCDHKDVTGAAIKAGNVGEGRVERAVSIHFSCGPRVEIVQVNEDSTCHYVVEVTVPDLCEHPLFKAAVAKKRVVKCLPSPNLCPP